MTVYRFPRDEAWPEAVSACTGACPEKRPVVAPPAADDTRGVVRQGLMSFARPDGTKMSFTRPDGTKQRAAGCRPVRTFAVDE